MPELFRKKERIRRYPSESDLRSTVADFLEGWRDPIFRERLFNLAGIPENVSGEFQVQDSKRIRGGIDVVTEGHEAFSLGLGDTSLIFVNYNLIKDALVYKSEPLAKITDYPKLKRAIRAFIYLDPVRGEIINISKEAREKKMNIDKDSPAVDSHLFPSKEWAKGF